jgi:hypothetical protein
LTTLKENLTAIKALFTDLNDALTGILSDTQSLLGIWSDLQTRLATVETVDRKTTEDETVEVVGDWTKAQKDATTYIDAILGSGATTKKSGREVLDGARVPRENQIPKIPRTRAELRMAALFSSLGLDLNDT